MKELQLPVNLVIAAPTNVLSDVLLQSLTRLLSTEEQAQASRFRKQDDQQRYILAHGLKRLCLSQLLGIEAMELQFTIGPKGKPYCDNANAPAFNLSHSGNWVLLGLSSSGDIGVDVEYAERVVSDAVAEYFLSADQLDTVRQDGRPQQRLMAYWTQKEAISKAFGLGLSIDFKTLSCDGLLMESLISHECGELTIKSQRLDDYMVSIAVRGKTLPELYRLTDWVPNSLNFNLEMSENGSH